MPGALSFELSLRTSVQCFNGSLTTSSCPPSQPAEVPPGSNQLLEVITGSPEVSGENLDDTDGDDQSEDSHSVEMALEATLTGESICVEHNMVYDGVLGQMWLLITVCCVVLL